MDSLKKKKKIDCFAALDAQIRADIPVKDEGDGVHRKVRGSNNGADCLKVRQSHWLISVSPSLALHLLVAV